MTGMVQALISAPQGLFRQSCDVFAWVHWLFPHWTAILLSLRQLDHNQLEQEPKAMLDHTEQFFVIN